jgi:hypothetical protein
MSDEKRQTRLLPFRLRRAAQASAADYAPGARDVSARAEESSEDAELSGLLHAWDAPEPSTDARERLLAEFRAGVVRAPLWRRALSAELRVPLPVAACAALALLSALFVLASRAQTPAQSAAAQSTNADVRTTAAPAVKIVELPVERERVVTRIVYVEKNAPRAEARQSTSTRQQETMPREAVTLSNSNREARAVRAAFDSGSRPADEPTSYFTRVDMADFQPADEMKIRIVKRGKADEK